MREPFNPTSDKAFSLAVTAIRRYCWCVELCDGDSPLGIHFGTCSYCWASRQQDREDHQSHREWLGDSYPGDPFKHTARLGCAEHGIDHPHLHCRESQR